jgi:hypothetical protein
MKSDRDLEALSDSSRRTFLKQAGMAASLHITGLPALASTVPHSPRGGSPPDMIAIPEYMTYAGLPDGKVIGVLGALHKNNAVARYSSDEGATWGEENTLFPLDGSGGWGLQNCFLDKDGELQVIGSFSNDAENPKTIYDTRYDIWHARSRDGRRSWNRPTTVWKGYAGSLLSFLQLRDGRVIVPFCYLTHRSWAERGEGFDQFTYMGRFSSSAAHSDDSGQTWHTSPNELKEPTPQIGEDGGIEPCVLELKSGRLWMLIRTQNGRFFESFSEDRGAGWTHPVPTGITSSDSPCSLTRLRDGRVVMLWNNTLRYPYANGGRSVLHGAISEDDGKTWRGYREVAANPYAVEPPPPNGDHGVTYTVPALTASGKILTSLSTGHGRDTLILRVDPEWLYETKQDADLSKGLRGWSFFGTRGVALEAHPDNSSRQVLGLRKPDPEWPAGVVWNFPSGKRGQLRIRLRLATDFAGALLGITDHFSVAFDEQDRFFNVFNLDIGPGGRLAEGGQIAVGKWTDLEFNWDCESQRQCSVTMNGRSAARLNMKRETPGPSYLRLRSTALGQDRGGLQVESVSVDVGAGWAK